LILGVYAWCRLNALRQAAQAKTLK
jgi:hypothetical protein